MRPEFDPWVGKIPWRRERLPTPVFWPGEFHGLYSPWGCKESDMTELDTQRLNDFHSSVPPEVHHGGAWGGCSGCWLDPCRTGITGNVPCLLEWQAMLVYHSSIIFSKILAKGCWSFLDSGGSMIFIFFPRLHNCFIGVIVINVFFCQIALMSPFPGCMVGLNFLASL